jgi:cytochrome c-type biogenesis protein CcmH
MTILFWLLAAAMLLVALSLLLPALTSGGRDGGVERDKLNIAVFHDQLKELENERAEGTLSEAQFEAARRELQRELLDEVGEGEAQATLKPRGRLAVPVVALLVPLLAIGLYLQLGESHLLTDEGQSQLAQAQQQAHDMANVEQMVQQLADRLQQDPNDLEGPRRWRWPTTGNCSAIRWIWSSRCWRCSLCMRRGSGSPASPHSSAANSPLRSTTGSA